MRLYMDIDVTFIMTVYNKEYYLPSVLKALFAQTGLVNPEYIFIDDASTDNSVNIIKEMSKDIKNVTIIANAQNKGISIRTNQGIEMAKGEWCRILDSDDILPLDSTEKMLHLAKSLPADMVYGRFVKTGKEPKELENCKIEEDFTYKYNQNALMGVLTGRFTRMGQLIKTSVIKKANGADERVFIQDETIPIRAAMHAKGVVKMDANVVLVPQEIGNFSGNKIQLDHDRFLAYYWAIKDNSHLSEKVMRLMYGRALSAYWKFVRKTSKKPYFNVAFFNYLVCKIFKCQPDMEYLDKIYDIFSAQTGIRRIAK
ncbi:MAG: glycosyltransferase family 2 protein [Alphaproteobacteria bacterium]|nr:glycosyltransferase family 2 protein [Alphaproteobacteria bacterium]